MIMSESKGKRHNVLETDYHYNNSDKNMSEFVICWNKQDEDEGRDQEQLGEDKRKRGFSRSFSLYS